MISLYDKKYEGDQYYTIGEISQMYGIGTDSLRYYEKKGILQPKREANGYRIYTQKDIWRLNVIRQLRDMDVPVDKIYSFFQTQSLEGTVELLNEVQNAIAVKQRELSVLSKIVAGDMETIEETKNIKVDKIMIRELPDRCAYVMYKNHNLDEEADMLMKCLVEKCDSHIHLIGNNRFASVLAEADAPYIYKGALMFDPEGDYIIPGGKYLSLYYAGKTDSRQKAAELKAYAEKHCFTCEGIFMDIVWIDNHTTMQTEEQISEVQVRIVD